IGFRFELIDLLIDFQLPSREIAVCPDDFRPYLVGIGSLHHASGSDGARNDEGIHLLSLVLFDGYDRINNLAGRIDADIVANGRRSRLLYDVGKSEDLRDRLDGNFRFSVAGCIDFAVDSYKGDSEEIGIYFGQRRNVVRILSFLEAFVFGVCGVQRRLNLVRRWRRGRKNCCGRYSNESAEKYRSHLTPPIWREVVFEKPISSHARKFCNAPSAP